MNKKQVQEFLAELVEFCQLNKLNVKSIYKNQMKYLQQVQKFLLKNKIEITIEKAIPQKAPLWVADHYGVNYWITLKNSVTNKSYSFDFWGSIYDKEQHKNPNAYDVLACLNTHLDGESFEDFCSSYGYEVDSIKAFKTYKATLKQNEGLKKIFSSEQLEELNNIN